MLQHHANAHHILDIQARLLGLKASKLAHKLTFQEISARGNIASGTPRGSGSVLKPLPPDVAQRTRDAITKATYLKLFDWLVARINTALASAGNNAAGGTTGASEEKFVGLLDLFGFEAFQARSRTVSISRDSLAAR